MARRNRCGGGDLRLRIRPSKGCSNPRLTRRPGFATPDTWRERAIAKVKGVAGELFLASLIVNLFALASPLFVMTVYNKVIGQQALDTLGVLALGMGILYAFDLLLRTIRGYISSHTGARMDALIGGEAVHRLLHLPYRHFEQTPFNPEVAGARPDLILTQRQQFDTRRRALDARRAEAARTVDRLTSDRDAAISRERRVARSRDILAEQKRSISELADKGYYPRLRYLSIAREANEMEGQHEAARSSVRGTSSSLAEAQARFAKIAEDWRSDILSRLTAARRERDRARSALLQQTAREESLVVRAPIAGIIQDVAVTAPGQSVGANTPLMSIVPIGVELLVEAVVSNADIGQVTPDQKSSVKVRAYDFLRYGVLEGRVERIAADSTQDPRTLHHGYTVTIRTDRAYLSDGGMRMQVHPGMEAQVELHIGKRSILSYLTDRLRRTTATALRER